MNESKKGPNDKISVPEMLALMVFIIAVLLSFLFLIKSTFGPNVTNSEPQGMELVSTNRPKSAVANATSRKSVDDLAHEMALESELNKLGFTSVGANPISFEKAVEKIEKQ